ncbi:hypothetical protein D3C80_1486050 [compost metagenome]
MKKKMTATFTAFAVLGGMGAGVVAGANLQEIKAFLNPSINLNSMVSPYSLRTAAVLS